MGHLSKLPLEVRERIYSYVIGHTTPEVSTTPEGGSAISVTTKEKNRLSPLFNVNRQIRLEATLVWIRQATFILNSFESYFRLCIFLYGIPHNQGYGAVRSLRMEQETLIALCYANPWNSAHENMNPPDHRSDSLTLHRFKKFPGLQEMQVAVKWETTSAENKTRLLPILLSGSLRKVTLMAERCWCESEPNVYGWDPDWIGHSLDVEEPHEYGKDVRDAAIKSSKMAKVEIDWDSVDPCYWDPYG
jgi:hypothetical protein